MSTREAAAASERPLPQRYALNRDIGRMYESEHGPWVRYEDCAASAPQAVRELSLTDELIDAYLGLAYDSSGLNGMCGEQWDRIVARRFFSLGAAVALGIVPLAPQDSTKEGT